MQIIFELINKILIYGSLKSFLNTRITFTDPVSKSSRDLPMTSRAQSQGTERKRGREIEREGEREREIEREETKVP